MKLYYTIHSIYVLYLASNHGIFQKLASVICAHATLITGDRFVSAQIDISELFIRFMSKNNWPQNIALPNITHILRNNWIRFGNEKKRLLIAYHAGDSAVVDMTDMCEFGGQIAYFEMRYFIKIFPEKLFSLEHKSNLK
jgi:hypothetical protein